MNLILQDKHNPNEYYLVVAFEGIEHEMKTIRLGVVMDPIESVNTKKDTTLAMLWAASDRGWELNYMRQQDLYQDGGEPRAKLRPLKVFKDTADFDPGVGIMNLISNGGDDIFIQKLDANGNFIWAKKRPDAIKHPGENGDELIRPLFSLPIQRRMSPNI